MEQPEVITPPLSDVSSSGDEREGDGDSRSIGTDGEILIEQQQQPSSRTYLSKEIHDVRDIYDDHMLNNETNDPYIQNDNNNNKMSKSYHPT